MNKGFNQYSPMQGILPLRERIASKMQELYSIDYNPETEVNITTGGTEAIFSAITAVVSRGEEVIIIEPAYDCYVPALLLSGGLPVFVSMKGDDYDIDWNEVNSKISEKTRLIIVNTPHNPTGKVFSKKDMEALTAITRNTKILILSDEVYEHIIFDGLKHESVSKYPELAERSFVVFSFGKTFHATGWKIGYILAPEALMTEFRKVHQFNVFCVNTPLQHALSDYILEKGNYLGLPAFYEEKRNYFLSLLTGSKFKLKPASGSYFQVLDYSAITDEDDKSYAIRLTKETGVASVPLSAFYHSPVESRQLRFCFAKKEDTLKDAAIRLTSF
jgi:methionine aminotransferase